MFHLASAGSPQSLFTFNKSLSIPSQQELKSEIKSLFKLDLIQFSQFLLMYCVLLPSFVLDFLQYVTVCLVWGVRNQTQHSRCGLTSAKQMVRITPWTCWLLY